MSTESLPRTRWLAREALAFLSRWQDRIRFAFEGWRERSQLQHEFDLLRQRGELDRTLSDSGINSCDLPRLMRAHPHTPQQLAAMMRRLGINRSDLPHRPDIAEAVRAMEWRCGECTDWRKCREWLATATPGKSYRAFCPNAQALDALRCSDAVAPDTVSPQRHGVLAELADENDARM